MVAWLSGALLAANAKGALDLAKMQEATEQFKHQETIKVGDWSGSLMVVCIVCIEYTYIHTYLTHTYIEYIPVCTYG